MKRLKIEKSKTGNNLKVTVLIELDFYMLDRYDLKAVIPNNFFMGSDFRFSNIKAEEICISKEALLLIGKENHIDIEKNKYNTSLLIINESIILQLELAFYRSMVNQFRYISEDRKIKPKQFIIPVEKGFYGFVDSIFFDKLIENQKFRDRINIF